MTKNYIENPGRNEIASPLLLDFFERWRLLKDEQALVRQDSFTLTEFEDHLPYMAVDLYDPATGRFQVKYLGSKYVGGFGKDNSGKYLDDIPNTDQLITRFRRLVETGQPYLVLNNALAWSPRDYKSYNSLACPLFDEDGDVVRIVFRVEFLSPNG